MADLASNFAGIRCPNPFWLASGPPTNSGEQIMRAFDAGWGGAVWKTIGDPIVNVSSRYSSVDWNGQRMMALNNIEDLFLCGIDHLDASRAERYLEVNYELVTHRCSE